MNNLQKLCANCVIEDREYVLFALAGLMQAMAVMNDVDRKLIVKTLSDAVEQDQRAQYLEELWKHIQAE